MMYNLAWTATPTTNPSYHKGALVRWRETPRGRWEYGYYRGFNDGLYEISPTAAGPVTIWKAWLECEIAIAIPEVANREISK